jgi:hypothetical protein
MLDSHVSEEIILLVADINMPGMSGLICCQLSKHAAQTCRSLSSRSMATPIR